PEGIGANGWRPIDPRDDPPLVEAVGAITKGSFRDIGQPFVLERSAPIIETLRGGTHAREFAHEMLLPNHPEVRRFDRAAGLSHFSEERADPRTRAVGVEFREGQSRGAGRFADCLAFACPSEPAKLTHEFPDGRAGPIVVLGVRDMSGYQAAKTGL